MERLRNLRVVGTPQGLKKTDLLLEVHIRSILKMRSDEIRSVPDELAGAFSSLYHRRKSHSYRGKPYKSFQSIQLFTLCLP